MGSSFTKDSNILILMEIDKSFYVAGDTVNGCVYLEAKENSFYQAMQIVVTGQQYIYWSEGSGKNRQTYRNHHKSYDNSFTLHNFRSQVPIGQFSFPFTFMLPNMMSGSYTYSSCCYIQYTVTARLTHEKMNNSQIFPIHLNILQPPRNPFGAITSTQTTNAKCCGCCIDYGTTTITLNSSTNFVRTGDNFYINGVINNTLGKQTIKTCRIMLEERRIMISSGGRTKSSVDHQYPLHGINNPINPGDSQEFNFETTVPKSITSYTAIGSVTARYFVIHVHTEYGCCANTGFATLHIVLHSKTPLVSVRPAIKKPSHWNPQEYPLIVCNEMKPFIYVSNPRIPMVNLPGQNNIPFVPPEQNYYNYQPNYAPYQQPYYEGAGGGNQDNYTSAEMQPYHNNELTTMNMKNNY